MHTFMCSGHTTILIVINNSHSVFPSCRPMLFGWVTLAPSLSLSLSPLHSKDGLTLAQGRFRGRRGTGQQQQQQGVIVISLLLSFAAAFNVAAACHRAHHPHTAHSPLARLLHSESPPLRFSCLETASVSLSLSLIDEAVVGTNLFFFFMAGNER